MRSTPIYEVHAVKYAHLPRKAWEVQITPDPHDADFPMDYFVWVAIPLDENGHRTIGGKPIVQVKPSAPIGCKLVGTVKGTKLWAGDCMAAPELRTTTPDDKTPTPLPETETAPKEQQ